jgi:hypothetical protein
MTDGRLPHTTKRVIPTQAWGWLHIITRDDQSLVWLTHIAPRGMVTAQVALTPNEAKELVLELAAALERVTRHDGHA